MARITIEFQTDMDTLEDIVNALRVRSRPAEAVDPDEPEADFDEGSNRYADAPGHYAPGDTIDVADDGGSGATATVTVADDAVTSIHVHSAATPIFTDAMLLEASRLGPKDGDRARGHARPPSKRRTNAQIAEDQRWFDYLEAIKTRGEAALAAADKSVSPTVEDSGEAAEPDDQPEGVGDGIDQAPTGDDPAEAAQDAADEAVEAAKAKTGSAPGLSDLQKVVADYTKKFGIAKAVTEVPKILGKPVIKFTPEEMPWAIRKLQAAIYALPPDDAPAPTGKFTPVETAAEPEIDVSSAFDTAAPEEPPPSYPSTLEGVKAAMVAYGKKYDGTEELAKMKRTAEDMPKLLQKLFGIGVVSPGRIPAKPENWGKAILAITAATADNPFGRVPR